MATLVLSTVGTVLGGPVGGAIGALVGQSIDQQVLAPVSRGPRVGDLSVQTSSYGTQVPRIYGTMRVAGSVIWATDLVESSQTTGAKGQPDATYSYSVSLAVALSSRPVSSVGRIWADGKLLRGVDGAFKVPTTFRFYGGSEDQEIDPLIGSIEGVTNIPAYRGLALAVFENLELAEFGNRIPFLTFEIVAESEPVPVAEILSDSADGYIASNTDHAVIGYAAYGSSVRTAIDPLLSCYNIDLFDDGTQLRAPTAAGTVVLSEDVLGSSANLQSASRIQREQSPMSSAPAVLRMSYYDPVRDFQAGEARASASDESGREERLELPAVVSADDAKSLVHQMIARRWARRNKLTLRLPPAFLELEPGDEVEVPPSPQRWMVDRCTIDAFVVIAELTAR